MLATFKQLIRTALNRSPRDPGPARPESAPPVPETALPIAVPLPETPEPPVTEPAPDPLALPFDGEKAALFRARFAHPDQMAGFIDFVIAHLLTRDHRSIFWGDRMLTIDKSAGFMEEPAFKAAFAKIHGSHQYDQYTSTATIAWRQQFSLWPMVGLGLRA